MKTRFLALAVCLFVTTSIFAQPGQRGEQWQKLSPERKAMIMKKRQEMKNDRQPFFTEDQKETMKEMRLETAKQVKPLRNGLNELAAKQKTLTTADNADLKAINKNIDKMSEIKAEIAKIHAKQHQEIRSLLTEEQLIKFDAMKQHRAKKGNMRNRDFRAERRGPGKRGA
jgi:Spy/CpxP family protein refolding chaperone